MQMCMRIQTIRAQLRLKAIRIFPNCTNSQIGYFAESESNVWMGLSMCIKCAHLNRHKWRGCGRAAVHRWQPVSSEFEQMCVAIGIASYYRLCASYWFLCQTFIACVFILSFAETAEKCLRLQILHQNHHFAHHPRFSLVSFCHRRARCSFRPMRMKNVAQDGNEYTGEYVLCPAQP